MHTAPTQYRAFSAMDDDRTCYVALSSPSDGALLGAIPLQRWATIADADEHVAQVNAGRIAPESLGAIVKPSALPALYA